MYEIGTISFKFGEAEMNLGAIENFLDNLWFRRLLWMLGGSLWMLSLWHFRDSPVPRSLSLDVELQGTVMDDDRQLAIINGRPFARGQRLVTGEGTFRIHSIAPRRAVLERGRDLIALELPAPRKTDPPRFPFQGEKRP